MPSFSFLNLLIQNWRLYFCYLIKWKNFHLCSILNLLTSTCRINPKDIKLHNFNWQCILSILKSTIPLLISFSWFSFFFSSRRRRVYGRKWLRRRSRMLEHCRGLHLYLHNKGIQRIWEGMYRRVVLLYTKNIGWMNEHLPYPDPTLTLWIVCYFIRHRWM